MQDYNTPSMGGKDYMQISCRCWIFIKHAYLKCMVYVCVFVWNRNGKRGNLPHDLSSIEEHFVSFSEAIVRNTRLLFTLLHKSKTKCRGHVKTTFWIAKETKHFLKECYHLKDTWNRLKKNYGVRINCRFTKITENSRDSLNLLYRNSTTIPINETATAAPISTPVS